jgi:phosphoribosylanthranilate isomerase
MKRPRVKICGLTRLADAELAVRLGADALGFVLWEGSPRHVSAGRAGAIAGRMPAFVSRVGVLVNMPPAEARAARQAASLDALQLHGDEILDEYAEIQARLIKAVTLVSEDDVVRAAALPSAVTVLVDAGDSTRRGGTGQRANWALAARLARLRPIVLAGGLTAETVDEAIHQVEPWAVDVSSGVEDAPGIKNSRRMEKFFEAIHAIHFEF